MSHKNSTRVAPLAISYLSTRIAYPARHRAGPLPISVSHIAKHWQMRRVAVAQADRIIRYVSTRMSYGQDDRGDAVPGGTRHQTALLAPCQYQTSHSTGEARYSFFHHASTGHSYIGAYVNTE
eukprot:3940128-Rhodomonas_salina.2